MSAQCAPLSPCDITEFREWYAANADPRDSLTASSVFALWQEWLLVSRGVESAFWLEYRPIEEPSPDADQAELEAHAVAVSAERIRARKAREAVRRALFGALARAGVEIIHPSWSTPGLVRTAYEIMRALKRPLRRYRLFGGADEMSYADDADDLRIAA